ncbi:MAG: hypothetical protein EBR88_07305 [Betaproteobacteria bacterium]|nr:hypothetical protein [Betaproteobacteria bacterium]
MAAADDILGRRLGVSPQIIIDLRMRGQLIEGEHWHTEGRAVVYTPAGELYIEGLLCPEKKEGGAAAQGGNPWITASQKKKGAAHTPPVKPSPQTGTRVKLTIHALCPNRTWVRVLSPERQPVLVRVRNQTGLRRGAQIECALHKNQWLCVQRGLSPHNQPAA